VQKCGEIIKQILKVPRNDKWFYAAISVAHIQTVGGHLQAERQELEAHLSHCTRML